MRRLIAQSLACWVYADGPQPYSENDPLDLRSDGPYAIVVEGVVVLERLTTGSPPLEGVVLRYGQIYGPGTGFDEMNGWAPLHVDAAAHAALLAIEADRRFQYRRGHRLCLNRKSAARAWLGSWLWLEKPRGYWRAINDAPVAVRVVSPAGMRYSHDQITGSKQRR